MTQEDIIHNTISIPITKIPPTMPTLLTLLTREIPPTIISKPTTTIFQLFQISLFQRNRKLIQCTLILTRIKIRYS